MRKHRRFFLFPLASRKKDHRIMFYFLYRHLTLWSQFAKGTFLPAWGSDWHIEHSTSNDQDFPRQRLSKEWLYAIAAFYGFAHTHKNINQKTSYAHIHSSLTSLLQVWQWKPQMYNVKAWACQCVPEIKVCGKFYHRRFHELPNNSVVLLNSHDAWQIGGCHPIRMLAVFHH